ncbi:MAG: sulfite exporter TauE/SafE family protein [Oceanospirillaceae bacterium]|nr:sulfite exporter TauE/SafE family protein [Oceanospirillaceae bacterium]
MIEHFSLLSAFVLGFFGSTHCLGMCGGIVSSFNLTGKYPLVTQFTYHAGRISTYACLGMLFGLLGEGLGNLQSVILPLRLFAGFMLILMGIYLLGKTASLLWLEKSGSHLWRFISPLSRYVLPVQHNWQAFILGMIWGFLPCGLIYSTLPLAMGSGDALQAGLIMLCFGLGTLPLLLSLGLMQQRLMRIKQNRLLRIGAGLIIIGFGVWSIVVLLHTSFH